MKAIVKSLYVMVGFIALSLLATDGRACAACFGATDSKLAEGMNWGIMSLLVVIVSVLATVASFFLFLARRASAVDAAVIATESMTHTSSKV